MVMLLPFVSFSQRNFYRYSLGFGAGLTKNQGDLPNSSSKDLISANMDYFFSPYIQSGLEIQSGKFYGAAPDSRFYQNHFKSLFFVTRVHAGQFMRQRGYPIGAKAVIQNIVKGIYGGAGLGVIASNQKNIFRDMNNASTYGANKSTDAAIPVTLGIDNSGFDSRIITGISYQGHFALGDQLDGYSPAGSKRDFYSAVTLSVKFRFGTVGVY